MQEPISRLSRLNAILLKLQSRPFVSVQQLAEQFGVSRRTIYRDIAALEESGVPIVSLDRKGFTLMEGYNVPPVMFTESEANAMVIAEKIIARSNDQSLIAEFSKAVEKVKAVLKHSQREKADFLAQRTIIGKNWDNETNSDLLSRIQEALTDFKVLQILYLKAEASEPTKRELEPFAIYQNTFEKWVLIAWCRLRKEFRSFRLDRMQELKKLEETFTPHKLTLSEYVEMQRKIHGH